MKIASPTNTFPWSCGHLSITTHTRKAKQDDDHRYQEAAEFLKKKNVASDARAEPAKGRRRA